MNSKVEALLHAAVEAARTMQVADYAIGGAVAMEAYGYERETQDVDLFVVDADRNRILRGLRMQGLIVFPITPPIHYAAKFPEEAAPEVRIDVLFSLMEPELSAVKWPDQAMLAGDKVQVFPLNLLVRAKFYANRADKDIPDIAALLNRGLFDPDAVRTVIASIDLDGAVEFDRLIAQLSAPHRERPRPTKLLRGRKPRS